MERPAFFTAFLAFVNTHGFWLRLGLAAALALAALLGARLYRLLAAALRRNVVARLPEWVRIVYDGFAEPLVLLLRAALVYGAVLAAPLPAPPARVNAVAGPLFSAAVIALLR